MSSATHTYTTKMQVDGNGDATYEDIAEVVKISGLDIEISSVEVTHLTSPNAAREFIPGLLDAGELTFDMNFTKSQLNTLYGYKRTTKPWRLLLADGSSWSCSGHITKYGTEVEEDDAIMNSITIKFTGLPTFVAA